MHKQDTETLRLLHVLSGDLWAGAEVMAHTLACELAHTLGHDVRVALLNPGTLADRLRGDGIETHIFDERSMNAAAIYRGLAGLCKAFRPQVVHTHRKKENVLGALAARRHGARSLRTVHGWTEFPDLGLALHKRLSRFTDVASGRYLQDRVVAVSDDLRAKLEGVFGARRLAVVENGVNLAAIRKAGRVPAALAGATGRRRIGIIARLVPVKRHDRFVDAATALLAGGRDDVEFYIAGDGPEAATIAARIAASGHEARIHALGFCNDALAVTAALDAVVVCSDHEGIPMNVLEAAALGVPVVTAPLPSIAGILDSGAPGLVAGDASPAALAGALAAVLDGSLPEKPALDDTWRYSARTMAAGYDALYRAVRAN